jgi:hypothetical protein
MKCSASRSSIVAVITVAGLLPGLAGCRGTDEEGARGPDLAADRLYLVQSRLNLPDGRMNYFTPVPALGEGMVDTASALEAPGNARLYAEPGVGAFMLGLGENATVTKVEVGADRRLVKGASVSFAGLGVQNLGVRAVTFVDADRALYRDGSTLQVVEWNSTSMTITRSIPLPADLARPSHTTFTGYGSVRRGDRILFPVMWFTTAADQVPAEVALVTVDLTTGQASAVRDSRCPAAGITFTGPDGATYFFNQLTSTYADRMFKQGRSACALRIRAGETAFDPDYLLEVGPMVHGAAAAAVGWGGAGRVWFRALDETGMALAPGTTYAQFFATTAWRLWHLDVTRPELGAIREPSSAPASCCGQSFVVDGVPYGLEIKGDSSTLVDFSGEAPRPTLSARGVIDEVTRLR